MVKKHFSLYIPDELLAAIRPYAERDGRAVSQLIVWIVRRWAEEQGLI